MMLCGKEMINNELHQYICHYFQSKKIRKILNKISDLIIRYVHY